MRPTKEQVRKALYEADSGPGGYDIFQPDVGEILAAEVRALQEELEEWKSGERVKVPGCECTWEIGDSECPVHPINPATEQPYEQVELAAMVEQKNAALNAASDALDDAHATIARVEMAGEAVLQCWAEMTSQELYGGLLRGGIESEDLDDWEKAHAALRGALRRRGERASDETRRRDLEGPSTEDVDYALTHTDAVDRVYGAHGDALPSVILAAEVRALRELVSRQARHLRAVRDAYDELEVEVKRLEEKWRCRERERDQWKEKCGSHEFEVLQLREDVRDWECRMDAVLEPSIAAEVRGTELPGDVRLSIYTAALTVIGSVEKLCDQADDADDARVDTDLIREALRGASCNERRTPPPVRGS